MTILGLHHISIVSADAQRTLDFYRGVLGLRLVKQTVNFDAPESYHLYFGNKPGRPGTAITFLVAQRAARPPGIGGTHHFALAVPDASPAQMEAPSDRSRHGGRGPLDRHYFTSIYFAIRTARSSRSLPTDRDGPSMRLPTPSVPYREPPDPMVVGNRDAERNTSLTWPEPVPGITGHGVNPGHAPPHRNQCGHPAHRSPSSANC